jgi:hypothetical protein
MDLPVLWLDPASLYTGGVRWRGKGSERLAPLLPKIERRGRCPRPAFTGGGEEREEPSSMGERESASGRGGDLVVGVRESASGRGREKGE